MYKKKNQIIENILLKFPKLSRTFYKYSVNNKLGKFLKDFQLKNKINFVYDIGAFKGEWSNFYKNTSLTKSNFILFEANKEHIRNIDNSKFQIFNVVLSDKKKEVRFYNNKNSSGDSYYKENTYHHKDLEPEVVSTSTLDDLVKENNLSLPDFIKIDTQGSELDILKGSTNSLLNCKLIYLECPLARLNLNDLNIQDYLNFLNKIGFIPQEVCEIHYFHEFLVQIDILFIKKDFYTNNNYENDLVKSLFNK
jgi:FkbM family methyltransferase